MASSPDGRDAEAADHAIADHETADDEAGGGRWWGWPVLLVGAMVLVVGTVVLGYLLHHASDTAALADHLEPPSGAVPTAPQLRPGQVLTRLPAESAVLSTVSVQPHGHAVEARRLTDGSLWWTYRRPSTTVLSLVRTGPTSAAVLWADGRLQVLDSLTGRAVWQRNLDVPEQAATTGDVSLGASAAASSSDVPQELIVTIGGTSSVFDAQVGTPLWRHDGVFASASNGVVLLSTPASAAPVPSATPSSGASGGGSTPSAASSVIATPATGPTGAAAHVLVAYDSQSGQPLGVLDGRWRDVTTTATAPVPVVAAPEVTLGISPEGEVARLFAFPPLPAPSAPPSGAPTPTESAPTSASTGGGSSSTARGGATGAPTTPDASGGGTSTAGVPTPGASSSAGGGASGEGTPSASPTAATADASAVLAGAEPWWQKSFPLGSGQASIGVALATPLSDLTPDAEPVVVVLRNGTVSAYTAREGTAVTVLPSRVAVSGGLEGVSVVRDRLVISTNGEVVVVGLEIRAPV